MHKFEARFKPGQFVKTKVGDRLGQVTDVSFRAGGGVLFWVKTASNEGEIHGSWFSDQELDAAE